MSDDTLYIEFGENKGPLEFEDGIGPIALATTRLMAAYLVEAEVRDNPPASEVDVWPFLAKQGRNRAHGVVLAPCIFYNPVRPPMLEKLHGFMSDAIKAGHLPLRERDTLYPFRLDQVADIDGEIRQDGYISIADVWKWQRTSGVPTFKTAQKLWTWCNPRLYGWYGLYTLPDGDAVETVKEVQSNGMEVTTFKKRDGAKKAPTPDQVQQFNEHAPLNWDASKNSAMNAFSAWLYEQEGGERVTAKTLGKYFDVDYRQHALIPTDKCKEVWAKKGLMEIKDDGN